MGLVQSFNRHAGSNYDNFVILADPMGKLWGRIFDKATNQPVEHVTVELKKKDGAKTLFVGITDNIGKFVLEGVGG
ncbi:MAG: hypothetical protein QM715_18325 [Nibricoccus sp.]